MTGCRIGFPRTAALLISMIAAAGFSAFLYAPEARAATDAPLHIMLDPGHGGTDTGASRGALKESKLALEVSLQLAEFLKADARFKTSLTRMTDRKVSLSRRTQLAENAKADLFLSIHLNSSPDVRARGTEIYFQNQLPADEESMFLVSREHEEEGSSDELGTADSKPEPLSARTDLKRILEDLHRNHRIQESSEFGKTLLETLLKNGSAQKNGSRGIRQAPFQVVSSITVPSVLVEVGFISNPQEASRLADHEYQKKLARGLYEGLVKYKESLDNEGAGNLKSEASATPQK